LKRIFKEKVVNRNTEEHSTLHKIISVRQIVKQVHFLKETKKLANCCQILILFCYTGNRSACPSEGMKDTHSQLVFFS
jgi:hypothetical protein